MKRFLISPILLLLLALFAGCDLGNLLGGDQDSSDVELEEQVPPPADPLPVSEQEEAAISALRERGAKVDLDDAGHVRIVELVKTKASNDDLKMLSEFPCLEALDITGGEITDAGLVHLKDLQSLRRLYLNDLPITSDALANISDLTKLDVLSLRNTKVGDQGMSHLKKLTLLTVLNLSKTAITNRSLKQIQGLTKIDTLVLADTAVTGKGFAYLKPLKALRTLNVDRCKSISGYLAALNGLDEMRMLYVHGCTVSKSEVKKLTKQNRKLAVFPN